MYCCLYTIFQLWIRRYCLAGCWKLFLNSQSFKDRVIEKLALVSRWPDWLAIVMSQQGFCHWDTFLCDKNYMYHYITTGIIIRHVQNALPILTKTNIDVNTLDEFGGIYKATLFWGQISHYYYKSWGQSHDLKSCPYDQEGFIAVLLVMPKSHMSEFKKDKIWTF